MAARRVRHAHRDDKNDEETEQQTVSHSASRRKVDSSGDEGSACQAALPRRPQSAGRLKHMGNMRPEEPGDLRPSTPPAGPSSTRSIRQTDWASAVLQMLQHSSFMQTHGFVPEQRSGPGSVSSKRPIRQTPGSGAPRKHCPCGGLQQSSSTKIAAARTLDNSSSDENEAFAGVGSNQSAVPTADRRTTRTSRVQNTSNPGSSTRGFPTVGVSNGGFASAAFEGLQVNAQITAKGMKKRASLRRAPGNDSVVSEVSHQESLASSKQTLGSSKLSATVQRVVARQRLLDSSSGEEDNDALQELQHVDSDLGQAARLLTCSKSISSSTTASGFLETRDTQSSPNRVLQSEHKNLTTGVMPMNKGKTSCGGVSVDTSTVRPIFVGGPVRARGGQAENHIAFSFDNAPGFGGSVVSDGISPGMHQAAAAATAEVLAAAACSLRPLLLTTIVPARLASPGRSRTTTEQTAPDPPVEVSLTVTNTIEATSTAIAARQPIMAHSSHVSSSQRIATWLEHQPSLCSVGIVDDIVSEYATTLTGTEIELDHAASGVKANVRALAMAAMENILSGDVEPHGSDPAPDPTRGALRSQPVRLTISSDEEAGGTIGSHGHKPTAEGLLHVTTERRRSLKQIPTDAEPEATTRLSPDAQCASTHATGTGSAARRLEFASLATLAVASQRVLKAHASSYSSPSVRPSETQSLQDLLASLPFEALDPAVPNSDKAMPVRTSTINSPVAVTNKEHLSVAGLRLRPPEPNGAEEQHTEEASSPESSIRAQSGGHGKQMKLAPLAEGGRLTSNELRVMLSVLSRPPWASAPAQAVLSSLTSQPSHSAESVQSFSYSEMLQVMRTMSSNNCGVSQYGGSTQDGSRSVPSLKNGSKGTSRGAATMPFAVLRRPPSQQLQSHHPHRSRTSQDSHTAQTSLEVKTGHSMRSSDVSSCHSSLLGEHPMAAPQERDWSASASTVSGRTYNHDQQQRDFTEMVRLWNMLTGRQLTPESRENVGLHIGPDGTATPGSVRRATARVRSAGSGSVMHQSTAALAASAAAMATSDVMAAAEGGGQHNTYFHNVNLHPFLDPAAAASAASHASQDMQQEQQQRSLSPAAAAGTKGPCAPQAANSLLTHSPGSAATVPHLPSPAQLQLPRPKSTVKDKFAQLGEDKQLKEVQQQDDDAPAFTQNDLMHFIRLFSSAGKAEVDRSEASEPATSNLERLMHMLRNGPDALKGQNVRHSHRLAAAASSTASEGDTSFSPKKRRPAATPEPSALTATGTSAIAVTESPRMRVPLSRCSSADTVETGLALGRLYQSLRNLRVRDEGGQTEATERPTSQIVSGCVQTNSSDLQASRVGVESSMSDTDPPVGTLLSHEPSSSNKAPEDTATTGMHGSSLRGQSQTRLHSSDYVPAVATFQTGAISSLIGQSISITRALKLPNGQLMELDSLLSLATDDKALGAVDETVSKWLKEIRTQSAGTERCPASGGTILSEPSPGLDTDSAVALGTSITAAPAILTRRTFNAVPGPALHLSIESAAAFPLRDLPIASEGGIMAASNQEAVTTGRIGSAGGMMAYLEAADPTTATALLELVQALQLMTLHARRRRWISDCSSMASGTYLVDPQPERVSLGSSSGDATTLRCSFGTSIGPSISQAGQASLMDMPDGVGVTVPLIATPVKAATTGGVDSNSPAKAQQPKRQTCDAGLPPRLAPADAEPMAQHLRRALRAVSGGGTVRLTPIAMCETIHSGAAVGGAVSAAEYGRGPSSLGAATEAAKLHIARALELLSQSSQTLSTDAPATITAAARAVAADAELRAQEELVAALMALLVPGNVNIHTAVSSEVSTNHSTNSMQVLRVPTEASSERVAGGAAASGLKPQAVAPDAAITAVPTTILTGSEISPVKLAAQSGAVSPTSPLHARIQEVLQQAERASASISSLQVGLSPTAPPAAEVLEGVPFEQAIGFIMDGLRDFDGGPSNLARHLHLMYSPSHGGCVFYPTALESLTSRRQTAVALGAAALQEAVEDSVTSNGGATATVSDKSSEDPQPLTDAERERVQRLVSEAVAAAQALACGARREEAWNAERQGQPLEVDTLTAGMHAQEDQQDLIDPSQAALVSGPVPGLQHARISIISSPSAQPQIVAESSSSPGSARISLLASTSSMTAAIEPSELADSSPHLPKQQLSPHGMLPTEIVLPLVASIGGDAVVVPLRDFGSVTRHIESSIQRFAPVTIAGVTPLVGVGDSQNTAAHTASSQTFGGAMDLPEDSAVGLVMPHSTPFLPCGNLDEQLKPIQPGDASVLPQATIRPHLAVEASFNAPAMPAITRLPTFATPSAPAVRSVLMGHQAAITRDGVIVAVTETRSACKSEFTTTSKRTAAAKGSLPGEHDGEQDQGEQQEMNEDGWEPDMAGATRICSPDTGPPELLSHTVGLQPAALLQQQQQVTEIEAGFSSALLVVRTSPMEAQPSPAQSTGASEGIVDPEVPALTARDRFRSPHPSDAFQPNSAEQQNPLAANTGSCSPRVKKFIAQESSSGRNVELVANQSSPWQLNSSRDGKRGVPCMRLARDTFSGLSTGEQLAENGRIRNAFHATPLQSGARTVRSGKDSEVFQDRVKMETVESVEGRVRRTLFTAVQEGSKGTPNADIEAVATSNLQTEQLLRKAAQLLLQAMQRAAKGQPEQEAAFRVLSPILQGLADVEDSQVLQLKSFGSVAVQQDDLAVGKKMSATGAGAVAELSNTMRDTAARASSTPLSEIPKALSQYESSQNILEAYAAPIKDLQQLQHLATTADLESFKDDVMGSVRSALMEIVDMICSTVAQRASAAAAAPNPNPGAKSREASASPPGPGGEGVSEPGCAERSFISSTGPGLIPERSASPSLALEQQEIRITRAELEAFMFGKAILGRSTADDLLGVRLRQLYVPQALQDHGGSGCTQDSGSGASDVIEQQRRLHRCPAGHEVTSSMLMRGNETKFEEDVGEEGDAIRSESVTMVPRASPLRQPLGDGADFKLLFRRSIEQLRGYLHPDRFAIQRSPGTSGMDKVLREGPPCAIPISEATYEPSERFHGPGRSSTVPLPFAPVPRQNSIAEAATSGATKERVLSSANVLEVTLNPAGVPEPLICQMTATAAAEAVDADPAAMVLPHRMPSVNDDDVELEPYLSGGLQPEPTTGLARLPDPAAPATQPSTRLQSPSQTRGQPQTQPRRGTTDSIPEGEAIGDFLAALAEPMMQVVGILTQPGGGGGIGSRLYPRRSIVIEELTEEQAPSQLQLQRERPSRVPGFAATNSGSHVVLAAEDEDAFDRKIGAARRAARCTDDSRLGQINTPRAASEADLSRLHQPALGSVATSLPHVSEAKQNPHIPRSASSTPVTRSTILQPPCPRGNLVDHSPLAPATASGLPVRTQCLQTQAHVQPSSSALSRLTISSAPGTNPLAAEDRPLSSFVPPSDGGAVPRRRTHSPGPVMRQAALRQEPSRVANTASEIQTSRSVDIVASPPGTSLDELESFLRAFRTRIGTDKMGDEPAVSETSNWTTATSPFPQHIQQQQLALQHVIPSGSSTIPKAAVLTQIRAAALRDPSRCHIIPEGTVEPVSEIEDVCRSANLSETVSVNTTRRVITGFNMFTIRASGASAMAAAAAVEEAFSPRQKREQGLSPAAAGRVHVGLQEIDTSAVARQPTEKSPLGGGVSRAQVRSSTEDTGSGGSGPIDASRGSSSATPTNPLLREHLEHFQALLEKANDLVDRLMLADEDLTSEGGATEVAATPSSRNATPTSSNATRRQLTFRLMQQRSGSVAVTPQRQTVAAPSPALTPNTPTGADAASMAAATTLPAASLDPELAALFPATAARLTRPYANMEQSSNAANSLLSSAVNAVPQLARGADYIRSKGSTPLLNSPGPSFAGIPTVGFQPGLRTSVPTLPTPAQSVAVATPLALVASLLAEAHSRMEFQSLEEQRGADHILSAVLDEHFAHVLGTPRGFLAPPRISMACVESTTTTPTAAGAADMKPALTQLVMPLQNTPQHRPSADGQTPIGAFSQAFVTAATANCANDVHHLQDWPQYLTATATQSLQELAQKEKYREPENVSAIAMHSRQSVSRSPKVTTSDEVSQQKLQQPSSQERHEGMNDFLSQVMLQRSDILTSALDHVHRVGISATVLQPPTESTIPQPPVMLPASTNLEASKPMNLPESLLPPMPLDKIIPVTRDDTGIHARLPTSVIPGASGGLPLMPQPLMPYQEIDSESTRTSYNVSIAGSTFHPESSVNFSHGLSPCAGGIFPADSGSLQLTHRLSSVVGTGGVEVHNVPHSVTALQVRYPTSDSAIPTIPFDVNFTMAGAVAAAGPRGGYDLSHLIDDDDAALPAGISSVFHQSIPSVIPRPRAAYDANSFSSGRGSGGVSTLKSTSSLDVSHSHIPASPETLQETELRYNPVYDPMDPPLGGSLTGTAFGVAAATAAVGELSVTISKVSSHVPGASCMTTLHHETAYMPLALATVDGSDGGASGLESSLHSRLRSAGGMSTAVLVPNPVYEFPNEYDRLSPATELATLPFSVGLTELPGTSPVVNDVSATATGIRSVTGNMDGLKLNISRPSTVDLARGGFVSGRNQGTTLPLSPVDAAASPNMVNVAVLHCASSPSAGMADPNATGDSGFPIVYAPCSGNTSAEFSSLLANSLTESQINLLSVAPELPISRRQSNSLPQHLAAAQWLLQQQQQQQTQLRLNAGDASLVTVAASKAASVIMLGGVMADVKMSLDFEEISREATAVADTLSAHASAEAAGLLTEIVDSMPCSIGLVTSNMPALATAAPNSASLASTDSASGASRKPARPSSVPTTPVQKRHMGDLVAAVVRRFEAGTASSPLDTTGEVSVVAASATTAANSLMQPDAIDISTADSLGTSTERSADWQSVAFSTGSGAGALSHQAPVDRVADVPGVAAFSPVSMPSQGSLTVIGSGVKAAIDDEANSTVLTWEWIPLAGSCEVSHNILNDEMAEQQTMNSDPSVTESLGHESFRDQRVPVPKKTGTGTKLAKATERAGTGFGLTGARQSESPARPARRTGATAGNSATSSGASRGRALNNPNGLASRLQQARGQGSVAALSTARANTRQSSPGHMHSPAGAGSPGSARTSAVTASTSASSGTVRRATHSPVRTTPMSRVNRASMVGAKTCK